MYFVTSTYLLCCQNWVYSRNVTTGLHLKRKHISYISFILTYYLIFFERSDVLRTTYWQYKLQNTLWLFPRRPRIKFILKLIQSHLKHQWFCLTLISVALLFVERCYAVEPKSDCLLLKKNLKWSVMWILIVCTFIFWDCNALKSSRLKYFINYWLDLLLFGVIIELFGSWYPEDESQCQC